MKTLTNIDLYPVIRLTPFDFDEIIYPFDTKVSEEVVYQYWKKILSKNGLSNLEPIKKGQHYIKTKDIDNESLETLIEMFLVDISEYVCEVDPEVENSRDTPEEITPTSFSGGIIMTSYDEIVMTPQCCVSLQDHKEWSEIQPSDEFKLIWLGHPWIYYKMVDENILFTRLIEKSFHDNKWKHYHTNDNSFLMDASNYIEKTEKSINDDDLKYQINYAEMKSAINRLQNDLSVFQSRIKTILEKMKVVNPEKVADCFVNGNGEMVSYHPDQIEA